MTPVTLKAHLEGPAVATGQIALRDLVHFGRQLQTALDRSARLIAGQTSSAQRGQPPRLIQQATALQVTSVEKGSFTLNFELPRAQESLPGLDLGELALERLLSGLDIVRGAEPDLPIGYDIGVLVAWRDLGRLINHGIERVSFDLRTSNGQKKATYDPPLHTRIIERIAGPDENRVVLEGRLLMADFKETGLRCRLHLPAGSAVSCQFDESLTEEIAQVLRHYVRVTGTAEIDQFTGEIRVMRIRDVEMLDYQRESTEPVGKPVRAVRDEVDFWEGASIAELAETQQVLPMTSLDGLWGDFWPEDESVDDFIAAVRQWRREEAQA